MSLLIRNLKKVMKYHLTSIFQNKFYVSCKRKSAGKRKKEKKTETGNWRVQQTYMHRHIQYIRIKFVLIYPCIFRSMHVGKRLLYVYSLFLLLKRTN